MPPEHVPAHCEDCPISHPDHVIWNDEPFQLVAAPHRTMKIVRTKVVPPQKRREYNAKGWPRHLVIMREHSLKLPGDEVTLKIVTNADEAEDELPESIRTPLRDTGTYRDAIVTWRGRPVPSFVSARLTQLTYSPHHHATPVAHVPHSPHPPQEDDLSDSVLKSGLVIPPKGLLDAMSPAERELANLLIAHQEGGGSHSLVKIATHYKVSDETIRRRKLALEKKYPLLKGIFASFRSLHAKGSALPPTSLFRNPSAAPGETETDDE